MGIFKSSKKRDANTAEFQATELSSGSAAVADLSGYASGSAGDIRIFDVPERISAMIMAIVADTADIPIAQLQFKYIKEIKR